MIDNKLVIGYIGNGKSVNRYHIPFVLTRKDKFIIKTIYARSLDKKDWARIDGVNYTANLDDLLNDSEIDVVIVNTSSVRSHYEYALKVLNANKHCVVEKPFAENKAQAEEIFDLAKDKNLICEAYQNRRFDSDFLTTKKIIDSGKLGDIIEVESHFDYYRPEVPEAIKDFNISNSYYYGHACHTLDQIISYFGMPDKVSYDVRQLLGEGRMNDYFDVDMYYGICKVSVKSSYFRIKPRPKFVVYGKKGMFIKEKEDRQEYDLKHFYMPTNKDFGVDRPEDYGLLTYYDDKGVYHEEKVVSEIGNYAYYYDALYETIVYKKEPLVKPEETIKVCEMLEEGIQGLK